ncbi:MAG: DUF1573 domain-containing protein [Flavisolibacter sp.]|jgi:hypothetical protein|nr:DUF1573 domain-containing protein [Flavisolibacter sp.]
MKYIFFLFFSAMVFSCNNETDQAAANQQGLDSANKAAVTNDSAGYANIQWIDSISQDIGSIRKGQVVDISWKLKNTGSKPLIISNVAAGCGCTVAEKPEEPIPPGGEGIIRGKFDSNGQTIGEHQKSITVNANTEQQAYYLLFKVQVKE